MTSPEKLPPLTPADLALQSREQAEVAFGIDLDAPGNSDAVITFVPPSEASAKVIEDLSQLR